MAGGKGTWRSDIARGDVAHATVLLQSLPRDVTGVVAVAAFDTPEELRLGLQLREIQPPPEIGKPPPNNQCTGRLAAVIGREFLVPGDSALGEEDLLEEAVVLSSERHFRRKCAAYWRWQNEFLRDATVLEQRPSRMQLRK